MQHIPILYGIIYMQVVLAAKLWYDLALWRRKEIKGTGTKTVAHWKEWILMAVAAVPSIWNFAVHINLPWYWAWLIAGGCCAFYLWILFDGLYNKFRSFHWTYTGSIDPDDANTDKFLRRFLAWLQQAVKWVPLGFLIYLFTKFYLP